MPAVSPNCLTFHDFISLIIVDKKLNIVLVLAMTACRRIRDIAVLILNLGAGWRRVVNVTLRLLYPHEGTLVPIEWGTGCVLEPV